MEKISKAVSLLLKDPVSLFHIGYSQVLCGLGSVPSGKVVRRRSGVAFEFDFEYGPQIKKMYFDVYEPLTVRALKRFLKKGDTFIDVGANIGFVAMVAAGLVGRDGQTHCFEPSTRDFNQLKKLSDLNPGYQIFCHRMALGEKREVRNLSVAKSTWVGWNTLVPTFMRENDLKESIQVEVARLDDYLRENAERLGRIAMIKIDTEGFEYFVLKGLRGYFETTDFRPPILCEVTPRANGLMNVSMSDLDGYMNRFGYQAYSLYDYKRKVDLLSLKEQSDVLFLPRR